MEYAAADIGMFASVLTALLGLVMAIAALLNGRSRQSHRHSTPSLSILVPHLGSISGLAKCLRTLEPQRRETVSKVVVVLQFAEPTAREDVISGWNSAVELSVIQLPGRPDKSRAIRFGLDAIETEWVMLVDSDMELRREATTLLLSEVSNEFAAYGVVLSKAGAGGCILDAVVAWDKAISHGVWRWGRSVLGLWPNLPGQCFVIKTDLLKLFHDGTVGLLDDLTTTLFLIERGSRIRFVPLLIGEEEGRSTWIGLMLQRARWTQGLFQAGRYILQARQHRGQVFGGFVLHIWLYHGWPVGTLLSASILAAFDLSAAGMLVSLFVVSWSTLAAIGSANLRPLVGQRRPARPSLLLLPVAAVCVMFFQTFGAFLLPWVWHLNRSSRRMAATTGLHHR